MRIRVLLVFISGGGLFGGLVWVLCALSYPPPRGVYEGLIAGILVGTSVTVMMMVAHQRSLGQGPADSTLPQQNPKTPVSR